MAVWFEGRIDISCNLDLIRNEYLDFGALYIGVVSRMPGITSVKLVEMGKDFVEIETNEGSMKRTNIRLVSDDMKISVEFDEEYCAGSKITTNTHYHDEFTVNADKIQYRTSLSDVRARGLLGFLYRAFGGSSIGKAVLNSYKQYFETKTD